MTVKKKKLGKIILVLAAMFLFYKWYAMLGSLIPESRLAEVIVNWLSATLPQQLLKDASWMFYAVATVLALVVWVGLE